MKIMLSVHHPAWVHQFKNIIRMLQARGDDVLVLAITKDCNIELLEAYGIPYKLVGRTTGNGLVQKGFIFLWQCLRHIGIAWKYRPDYLIGRYSPMMAVASFFCRRRHIIFEDTEGDRFSLGVCKLFSDTIMTSTSFFLDLGPKQERVEAYKETFYLHPAYFTPDKALVAAMGIDPDEPYTVIRLVSWRAIHDVGMQGISADMLREYIRSLLPHGRVYLCSESPLEGEFAQYCLNIPSENIHHVLAHAQLFIGEGATMCSEAALLGTHAVFMGILPIGTTNELQDKYDLMRNFNIDSAERYALGLDAALEFLAQPGQKQAAREKAARVWQDKIDINQYYISKLTPQDIKKRHRR